VIAEARPRMTGTFHSKGLRLHYDKWGDPDAPIMVMLHGGLEHSRSWDGLASHFGERYRVICPDLRGHGESEHCRGGGYAVLDMVYDLVRLLRELGGGPFTLVGHSFGGNICVRYAGLFSADVSALVCIEGLSMGASHDPTHFAASPALHRLRHHYAEQERIEQRSPRRYLTIEDAVTRVMQNDPRLPHVIADHVTRHGLSRNEDGTFSWKYDAFIRGVGPSDITSDELRSLWSAITCPILLVYGKLGIQSRR
jgi:pimeloyl-ACP methyl ester carboxylesterase